MPANTSIKLSLTRIRRQIFSHYSLIKGLLATALVIVFILSIGKFLLPIGKLAKEFLFAPVNVLSVVFNQGGDLKNDNGRTNILLLGTGGTSHDGPNLTDAIMVLSVKTRLDEKDETNPPPVFLISIPRDIYSDSLQNKINSAYQMGLDQGVGAILSKSAVSQITGLPIHYAVVLDFLAFLNLIDIIGGVDVKVEHVLDDPGYPISGKENDGCGFSPDEVIQRTATIEAFPCRYEPLRFDIGIQHMNSTMALKFVRSRHGQNEEGTDFARSQRQQLVLKAIRDRVLSSQTIFSPSKILDIYNQIKSHINSDLDSVDLNKLLNLALKYRNAQIKTSAIDQNLLVNPPVDHRGWILLPKDGTWGQVHQLVASQLEN